MANLSLTLSIRKWSIAHPIARDTQPSSPSVARMVTTLILSIAPDTSFAVRAEFSLALAQMVSISTRIQTLVTDEKTSNVLSLHKNSKNNHNKDKDNKDKDNNNKDNNNHNKDKTNTVDAYDHLEHHVKNSNPFSLSCLKHIISKNSKIKIMLIYD